MISMLIKTYKLLTILLTLRKEMYADVPKK